MEYINCKVRIKYGWEGVGKSGLVIGEPIRVSGQDWLPVLWDDEEDPDFHKLEGIDVLVNPN